MNLSRGRDAMVKNYKKLVVCLEGKACIGYVTGETEESVRGERRDNVLHTKSTQLAQKTLKALCLLPYSSNHCRQS